MKTYLPTFSCLFFFFFLLFPYTDLFSQTVQITANPSQSSNIVLGQNFFHVSESIYTDAEIGSTNFITAAGAINHIDFNVFVPGTVTIINNFNLYLKEVPASTQTFLPGIYDTTGYTLVYSGSYNPSVAGWSGVDLTTNFVRAPGNNLQLLIERLDSVQHGPFSFRATLGNNTNTTDSTSRRENTVIRPIPGATVLNTATPFRPQIQLRHITANDAALTQIYTLGKLPIPFAVPHVISVNIINNGSGTLINLPVSLIISGANSFNDMQMISSLQPGASIIVSFAAFSPLAAGLNTVNVSIPADDFSGDNSLTVSQQVTINAYNYAYGTVPSGAVGIIPGPSNPEGTGDIVAKFTTSSPTSVNQVGVNFTEGGAAFRIGIWDKSGNGVPGNLLWESFDQVTTAGLFTLPVNPPIAVTDTFYVGVRQISGTNVKFAYQNETPMRFNTFYYANPIGNTVWTDFATGNPFKFMIEPRLTIANDVGITSLNNPVANSSIDSCGIVPEATVANFGSNNQSVPFDVTFRINRSGNPVYTDTKQVALNSGALTIIDFAPFTGLVNGNDSSFVYTSLATDGATNNDTVVNKFTTGMYSYGLATEQTAGYEFANSTDCASPSGMRQMYNWITQTDNEVNWEANGNDSILNSPIALPFNFYFMGSIYNQLWLCSNGWVSFSDPTSLTHAQQKNPAIIPSAAGIQNYIAGALTDLDLTTETYPDAHTFFSGDADRFVITFLHAHRFSSESDYITFQIILNAADSSVIIQYNEAESSSPVPTRLTNFCNVGIENTDGTKGISYRHNGSGGPVFGSPLTVKFRPVTIVPVSLLDFNVRRNKRSNIVSWSTSQEINSKNFIIEHSIDGRRFYAIGKVTGAGYSNSITPYSFTHTNPPKGINYYRLRLVDFNNVSKYSMVRDVRNEGTADLTIYPNPVYNKLNLILTADKAGSGIISITDFTGKLKYIHPVIIAAGINNINISTSNITTGVYMLKVHLADDLIAKKFTRL